MDDEPFYFCRLSPCRDVLRFLYVGEVKGLGLAEYLATALARVKKRPVSCLAIVPDRLQHYPDMDLIAVSPSHPLQNHLQETAGHPVSYRIAASCFASTVSRHPRIREIVQEIVDRQGELPLFMFESVPEMTLDELAGVILYGPDKELAHRLNHKGVQVDLLAGSVPMAEHRRCADLEEAVSVAQELFPSWRHGIFVSRPYSAAGSASAIVHSGRELAHTFSTGEGEVILSRYHPHEHDPTVLGVAGADGQVFIAGIADQRIEDGNRFVGSSWPTRLNSTLRHELYQYTRRVGEVIGKQGYRGIFGCDYIITTAGKVLFIELNARKQGTTLEFCHALHHILSPDTPSLVELELQAVTGRPFSSSAKEPHPDTVPPFAWATDNRKVFRTCRTRACLFAQPTEKELFRQVAAGHRESGAVVLDHVGAGRVLLPGTFLARTVAVGRTLDAATGELKKARRRIIDTLVPEKIKEYE